MDKEIRTVAYRKNGIGILYALTLLMGVFLTAVFWAKKNLAFLLGLAVIGGCIYILVGYCKTPREAIRIVGENEVILPRDQRIPLCEVTDISYNRAHARGITYRWGSVTVATYHGSFRVKYLADCESVAKELTRLMYAAKAHNPQNGARK